MGIPHEFFVPTLFIFAGGMVVGGCLLALGVKVLCILEDRRKRRK